MEYKDLQERAVEIRQKYDALNAASGQKLWDTQAYMAGFVGDVGDLSKLVMAKNNLRKLDNVDEKLAHELTDCLWSVLVLADLYNIDLPAEFMKTMDILDEKISQKLSN